MDTVLTRLFQPIELEPPHPDAIVVHYQLDGPRNPACVLLGRSRLTGMVVIDLQGRAQTFNTDYPAALARFGSVHRYYHDAQLARTIERLYCLPVPVTFDDVRIITHLSKDRAPSCLETPEGLWSIDTSNSQLLGQPHLVPEGVAAAETIRLIVLQHSVQAPLTGFGLSALYREIELPLTRICEQMTSTGMLVHEPALDGIELIHQDELAETDHAIHQQTGGQLAPVHLAEARSLHQYLQPYPVEQWRTIDRLTLRRLAGLNETTQLLVRRRYLARILNGCQMLRRNTAANDRLIVRHDPQGAGCGRICSSPDLETLPDVLRGAVIAPAGHKLVRAHYPHLELQVLAQLSFDTTLLGHLYDPTVEISRRIASRMFTRHESEVSEESIEFVNTLVLGICEGWAIHRMAYRLDLTVDDTERRMAAFFSHYPVLHSWYGAGRKLVHQSQRTTVFGRRLSPPSLHTPHDPQDIDQPAINSITAGTMADILKVALVRCNKYLPGSCGMLLGFGNQILVEVPESDLDAAQAAIQLAMEFRPPSFYEQLLVQTAVGPNWSDCQEQQCLTGTI